MFHVTQLVWGAKYFFHGRTIYGRGGPIIVPWLILGGPYIVPHMVWGDHMQLPWIVRGDHPLCDITTTKSRSEFFRERSRKRFAIA